MHEPYAYIYLSPHLDDAVLSCGAQIFQHIRAGHSVMIVTVMAADSVSHPLSDYAKSLHHRWEIKSPSVEHRREEDKAACAVLGAEYLHWSIPDCIYRRDPDSGDPLYNSDEDIFGDIDPADKILIGTIGDLITTLPKHDHLVAPLTIGNHVDHQLIRLAAELSEVPSQLLFYEEYPYIAEAHDQEVDTLTGSQRSSEIIAVSDAALEAKIEAISCYRLQISTFFINKADINQKAGEFMAQMGGERLWRLS